MMGSIESFEIDLSDVKITQEMIPHNNYSKSCVTVGSIAGSIFCGTLVAGTSIISQNSLPFTICVSGVGVILGASCGGYFSYVMSYLYKTER